MAKFLRLDGDGDFIKLPSITSTKIRLEVSISSSNPIDRYLLDLRTGATNYFVYSGTYNNGKPSQVLLLLGDGQTTSLNTWAAIPKDQRIILQASHSNGVVTDDGNIGSHNNGTQGFLTGDIFDIKFLNGETVVAHYDMSTGTVQDQSGNGKHATLTGGTWLDDGTGGTPTGEDGSVSVDTKQSIFSDSFTQYDSKQSIYADAATPYDIRNILYQDGSTSSDTKQVLYQISSTSFDMLQEIFNDGQVGSTPFDMRLLLYSDSSILHDSRQAMYESGLNAFDLKQAIYETGEGKADIHLVLFADSATHHDLIQSLYEDAQVQFDTRQTLFDTDKQVIGVIPLKGNRELYVYLAGRQQLTFPLQGKQDLFINLRGDVNVTIDNGLFKMYAGDSKYLPITVEGVTDFSGATAKWALMPSVYSTEHTLLKTIGDGISITDGKLQVKLDSVDTKNLLGKFYFETELTDALGNVSTVAVGEIEIKKSGV